MIHLFNRAELLLTVDLDRLNRVMDALSAAGIPCRYRVKDLVCQAGRGHTSAFGIRQDARVEYKLYVKRADLARAKALL